MGFLDSIGDALGGIAGGIKDAVGGALGGLGSIAGPLAGMIPGIGNIAGPLVGALTGAMGGGEGGGGINMGGLAKGALAGLTASQIRDVMKEAEGDRSRSRELIDQSLGSSREAADIARAEHDRGAPLRNEFRAGALNFFDPTNPFSRGGGITDAAQSVAGIGQGMDGVSQRMMGGGITSPADMLASGPSPEQVSAPRPSRNAQPRPPQNMGPRRPPGGSGPMGIEEILAAAVREQGRGPVNAMNSATGETPMERGTAGAREAQRQAERFGPMIPV